MVMELRKRKPAAEPAPAPVPKKKSASATAASSSSTTAASGSKKKAPAAKKAAEVVEEKEPEAAKEEETKEEEPEEKEEKKDGPIAEGDVVTLEGFGGEVQTNDGNTTTLKALVDDSQSGIVIFTYPKASTPGCTTQVCLFRDAYKTLTDAGLSVFGLSTDSPKANTTFKEKKELQYTLLCDPQATLIEALGLKKTPKGTVRGVVVLDKEGSVVVRQAGGPAATLAAVEDVLGQFK